MRWLVQVRTKLASLTLTHALLCVALVAAALGVSRVLYPYDLGHYEATSWQPALMAAEGRNPYDMRFLLGPPYMMSPYGPLYYWMVGWGLRWSGPEFWPGRATALAFALLSAWCIGRLTWGFTRDRSARTLSLVLFAAQYPVQFWLGLSKAGSPAMAFGLVGMVLVLRPPPAGPPLSSVLTGGVVFAAACFCQQTWVLPMGVAALWLIRARNYRDTALLVASFLVALLVPAYLLDKTSNGGFLWQAFWLLGKLPGSIWNTLRTLLQVAGSPVTELSVGAIAWLLWRGRALFFAAGSARESTGVDPQRQALCGYVRVLLIYFSLSTALSLYTTKCSGAAANHWLETSVPVSLLIPAAWHALKSATGSRLEFGKLPVLFVIAVSASGAFAGVRMLRHEYHLWQCVPYLNEIVAKVEQTCPPSAPCMSFYPELIMKAGRPHYFNARREFYGRWSESNQRLDEALQSRLLSAIVDYSETSPQGYRRAKMSNPLPGHGQQMFLHIREDLIMGSGVGATSSPGD